MDNLSHNTSEQNASIEPPDLPEGWRYADSEVWKDPYLAARKRVRALKVALVGLVLACVAGLLVWNAADHYARGVQAFKIHSYSLAAYEFSAARVLFFPYRDAQILEDQAQSAAVDMAADALHKQAEAPVVALLEKAGARLDANDANGVLATLQAIGAIDLQATLAGNATAREAADALARGLAIASRSALHNQAWDRAGRFAAALLQLEPSSQQAVNLASQARTGQDLSAKLGEAKDAARRGKWKMALRTALAVLAVQKDFPGAAAVVADARRALAPKPRPAASTAGSSTQATVSPAATSAPQPPPP